MEILIGLTIGAAVIGGVSALIAVNMRSSSDANLIQTASNLAQDELNLVKSSAQSDWHTVYNLQKGENSPYYFSTSTATTSSSTPYDFSGGTFASTTMSGSSVVLQIESPNNFGSGADGPLTIAPSANYNINTDQNSDANNSDPEKGNRTCADGAVYDVNSLTSNSATLASTPAAGCLVPNDLVLLINEQGNSGSTVNVGNYEILSVNSVSGNVVNLTQNKKYYGSGNSDNIGDWKSISSDDESTLAIKTDGTLWAWGGNWDGGLGLGSGSNIYYYSPVQVGTDSHWESVSLGGTYSSKTDNFTLAIKTDGTLWAWGSNNYGQLGIGNTVNQFSPVEVGTSTDWKSVSAGEGFTLAIKTDGTLWAWGINDWGQLGLGNNTNYNTPQQVGTSANWGSISAGESSNWWVGHGFALATKTDGTLWAWGYNGNGQLGLGNTNSYSTPQQVGTSTNWKSISAGDNFSLAIKTDDTLWAWGLNNTGQLGLDNQINYTSPQQVGNEINWQSASAGDAFSLAIKTDGTLWAWGGNGYGQLGLGNTVNQLLPVQVGTNNNWQFALASGNDFYDNYSSSSALGSSFAIQADNVLWVWGSNNVGQLGLGIQASQQLPTPLPYQKIILQRIPQYTDVTVNSGGSLTANTWSGTDGGILAFFANGKITIAGNINMQGNGYRTFPDTGSSYSSFGSGESRSGPGLLESGANNDGGGGGGYFWDIGSYDSNYSGGGGYGMPGADGLEGKGGNQYGSQTLSSQIFLGSAGGAYDGGGEPPCYNTYYSGGNGGGIVLIKGNNISISGAINNSGGNVNCPDPGTGSGGSIYLEGSSIDVGNKIVTAIAGTGGTTGGVGRIHIKYGTLNGTTNPSAFMEHGFYYPVGTYTSSIIDTLKNNSTAVFSWNVTLNGNSSITMQARGANSNSGVSSKQWCSVTNGGDILSLGSSCADPNSRYFQFKATLYASSDRTQTPYLNSVAINNFYQSNFIAGKESVNMNGTIFTRYFYLDNVSRNDCGIGDISTSSPTGCINIQGAGQNDIANDPSTQKITVVVAKGSNDIIRQSQYLTMFKDYVFKQNDWSGGSKQEYFPPVVNNKFAAFTGISVSTPGNLTMTSPTTTISYLISSVFYSGLANLNSILWQGLTNGGSVQFQIASANSSAGPWNYLGPDGTNLTYYSAGPGISIQLNPQYNGGISYFRYRIILNPDSQEKNSPSVNSIVINYNI